MALASGTCRPLLGGPASTARLHLAVSSSSTACSIRFPRGAGGGRAAVSLRAPAPPATIAPESEALEKIEYKHIVHDFL
ncbi:Iron-sulfur assembly protein IscA [Zea mays]|uniref:Iron-sulfur assembly protein IscA n=1 Tax=Zea mays TaxID=4577 RepID=A0A1D6NVJ1_MAIZE|nr:Iron-sulfur assembly protein IscA [Zea mays]